jgi:uncharacterized protein YukE
MRVNMRGSVAYPSDADASAIIELADNLGNVSNGLDQRGTTLLDTARRASGSWTGAAADAFVEHLDGRSRTVRLGGDALQGAVPVLRQYASAIESTQISYVDAVYRELAARRGLPETEPAVRAAVEAQHAAVAAHHGASARLATALHAVVTNVESVRATLATVDTTLVKDVGRGESLANEITHWASIGAITNEQRDRLLRPENLARLEAEISSSGRSDEESRANRARILVNTTDERERDLRLQQLAAAEARQSPFVVSERGFVNTFGTNNRGALTGGVAPDGSDLPTDGLRIENVSRTDGVRERRVYATDALGRDRLLGTDYGPVAEYMAAVPPGTGGDRPEAIRRQVSLPEAHRDLAERFIDPGSGQVDPARWSEFVRATQERGMTQMVTQNGIDNPYSQGLDNARIVAQGFTNGERSVMTVNVYNPTSGFGADLGESTLAQFGQRQSAQYALRSEIDRALGSANGSNVIVLGHSQGSINSNAAVGMLDAHDRARVDLINVGTAAWGRPEGTSSYLNVVDRNDVVWNAVAGRAEPATPAQRIGDQVERMTYGHPIPNGAPHTVETNFRRDGGPVAPNNHSLWLYMSRPEAFRGYNVSPQTLTSPFPIPKND